MLQPEVVIFEVTEASYMCKGCVAEEIGDLYDGCLVAIVGELGLHAGGLVTMMARREAGFPQLVFLR